MGSTNVGYYSNYCSCLIYVTMLAGRASLLSNSLVHAMLADPALLSRINTINPTKWGSVVQQQASPAI